MALAAFLVEILVCPEDKQPLWYLEEEDALVNLRLRRRYPIRDGIPVLLVDEAEPLDDTELARVEALALRSGVLTGGAGSPSADDPSPPAGGSGSI